MLTDVEKDELFDEFMVKLAQTSKEDRKLSVVKNNHALKGVARYYHDHFDPNNTKLKHDPELFFKNELGEDVYRYFGFYLAYSKLRAAVPTLVMVKKHMNKEYNRFETRRKPEFGDNPYLEDEDIEEATKIGSLLLDTFFKYLKENASNG